MVNFLDLKCPHIRSRRNEMAVCCGTVSEIRSKISNLDEPYNEDQYSDAAGNRKQNKHEAQDHSTLESAGSRHEREHRDCTTSILNLACIKDVGVQQAVGRSELGVQHKHACRVFTGNCLVSLAITGCNQQHDDKFVTHTHPTKTPEH